MKSGKVFLIQQRDVGDEWNTVGECETIKGAKKLVRELRKGGIDG